MTSFLSKSEMARLLQNAIVGTGRPMSEDELVDVAMWAEETRIRQACLEAVLDGELEYVYRAGEEPEFKAKRKKVAG